LENFLVHTYHHFFFLLLVLFAGALLNVLRRGRRGEDTIRPGMWWRLAGIVALAAALRFLFSPMAPQVYHDEFFYMATAENIANRGMSSPLIMKGWPSQPFDYPRFTPPYPQGWQAMLSLAYKWTGSSSFKTASGLSFFLSCLIPAGAFFMAYFFFGGTGPGQGKLGLMGETCGLYSALFAACLPALIRLSGSAASETASALFTSIFLACLFYYYRHPSPRTFLLLAASAGIVVNIRPENLLYVPVALPVLYIRRERAARDCGITGAGVIAASVLLSLAVLYLGRIDAGRAHVFAIQPRQDLTPLANFAANLLNNFLFFWGRGQVTPLALTLLSLAGFYLLGLPGSSPAKARLLGGWILFFYLILSIFPFGDFSNTFSQDSYRFSLHACFPLILAASYGCFALISFIPRPGWARLGAFALLLWIALSPHASIGFLKTASPYAYHYRALKEIRKTIPDGAIIFAGDAGTTLMIRYLAGGPSGLLADGKDAQGVEPGSREMFLFETEAPADFILENFTLDLFSERHDGRVGYSLFRMEGTGRGEPRPREAGPRSD
jgi:hypothetical protein